MNTQKSKMDSLGLSPAASITQHHDAAALPEEAHVAGCRMARLEKSLGLRREHSGGIEDEAVLRGQTETTLQVPASHITWGQIHQLAQDSPQLAEQKWRAVQQAANEEISNGHRAARMNQTANATPMERARHLALSQEMRRNFEPRSGIEEILLENLVQAQAQYEHWLTTYVRLNSFGVQKPSDDVEALTPPRLSEAEAIEQAMTMIERWQRMFLRCLRALKEWRRQPLIVANQVNIAEQQVVTQANQLQERGNADE